MTVNKFSQVKFGIIVQFMGSIIIIIIIIIIIKMQCLEWRYRENSTGGLYDNCDLQHRPLDGCSQQDTTALYH